MRKHVRYKIALGLLISGVWATWWGQLQIQHAKLSRTLLEAVIAGNEKSVKTLLEQGASPDAQFVTNDTRTIWQHIGDWVYRRQPVSAMGPPLLLTLMPQPIAKDSNTGSVPDEQAGIVAALLAHGAHPDVRDHEGNSILYLAYYYGHLRTAQLLLEAGADTNARSADGYTAVSLAAARGRPDWIQSLVAKGADVNVQDNDGWTPLMWVIRNHAGNAQDKPGEALRLLIHYGADVNKCEKTGKTALGWTTYYAAGEYVPILMQHGAKQ